MNLPTQVKPGSDHSPVASQVIVSSPSSTSPGSHVYVATEPNAVLENDTELPGGSGGLPQSRPGGRGREKRTLVICGELLLKRQS